MPQIIDDTLKPYTPPPPVDPTVTAVWFWTGALSDTRVTISVKCSLPCDRLSLGISTSPSMVGAVLSSTLSANSTNDLTLQFAFTGLTANTAYYARLRAGSTYDFTTLVSFKTFPTVGSAATFTFALGSCIDNLLGNPVEHRIFSRIASYNPLFLLQFGDLHYDNIATGWIPDYCRSFDSVLSSETQRSVFSTVPVIYMPDDHDYGGNDSDGTYTGKEAYRLAYQLKVPHYNLTLGPSGQALAQSFQVGRCVFFITDLRTERSADSATDNSSKTMLGATQKAWFKNTIASIAQSGSVPVIFWISTVPWIGTPVVGADYWAGFSTERAELAAWFKAQGVNGLFILAGDMHGSAADDGTNSKYAGSGSGPAVFQAAPIAQFASVKGGPWTIGPYPASGASLTHQFGLVTVTDTGGVPTVTFQVRDENDNQVFTTTIAANAILK